MARRTSLSRIPLPIAVAGVWIAAFVAAGFSSVHAQDAQPANDLGGLLEGLDLQLDPQSPAAPEPTEKPEQTEEPAAADPSAPSPEGSSPLLDAYRSMQRANTLLAQGETGEATRAAQQRAVDLLDQMIQAAQQQSPSSPSGEPPSPQPGAPQPGAPQPGAPQPEGAEEPAAGDSQPNGSGERAADGGEPSEGSGKEQGGAMGGPGQAAEQRNATAAAAGQGAAAGSENGAGARVWGHLPERTRGMLRAEMPTEYLPKYAREISEYFRQLAEMKPDE